VKPPARIWDLLKTGELQLVARALAFSTVLSMIPFLAVALATIQYVDGFKTIYPKVEAVVLEYFQGPTGAEGIAIIKRAFSRIQAGKLGTLGAAALIFASVLLINDMEKALHRIWNVKSLRPVYQRFFFYWIAMLLFPALLAVYVALTSLKTINAVIPAPILNGVLTFTVLFFIYKAVPNTKVSKRAAAMGALFGSVGLSLLFRSFKWISQSFLNWGKLYGGLAAVPTLLIWILLIWYVVLIGAAISASWRREEIGHRL